MMEEGAKSNDIIKSVVINSDEKGEDKDIVFKKRGKIQGIRRKTSNKSDIESKEDDSSTANILEKESEKNEDLGINKEKLKALEILKRASKSHSAGISVNSLNSGNANVSSKAIKSGSQSMFGSQFSVKMDYGLQKTIPHEKIMEEYVEERLGLKKQEEVIKPKTIDDELYQIPEELKVESHLENSKVKLEDEGVASSWGTGIAEIQLPMNYKAKNAIETQEATRRVDSFVSQQRTDKTTYSRFQIVDPSLQSSAIPREELQKLEGSEDAISGETRKRRFQRSTDDLVVERFKKSVFKR